MPDPAPEKILNVHTLSGMDLDRYVAEVINLATFYENNKLVYQASPGLAKRQWAPSKFWSQAGPIIEDMKIDLNWEWEEQKMWTASIEPDVNTRGKDVLEAAMRAVVATRYKQEFEGTKKIEEKLDYGFSSHLP